MSTPKDPFLALLAQAEFEQAAKVFCTYPLKEQAKRLEQLNTSLHKSNRATHTPKVLAVIQRQLKDDTRFDQFYEAWQPTADKTQVDDEHNHFDYFALPVRVINARNIDDPDNILSISMIACDDYEDVFDAFSARQSDEQKRAERIALVADKVASNEMYEIISDDILGE